MIRTEVNNFPKSHFGHSHRARTDLSPTRTGCDPRRLRRHEKRQKNPRPDVFETSGFHCRKLSESVYLLTYMLLQDGKRRTRRSTIWKRTLDGWKIVFHQGTIVDPGY